MKLRIEIGLIALIISASVGCKPSQSEPKRYAELRTGSSNKIQILIRGDAWLGLFGPEGYGGYAHNIYFWVTLQGDGPTYTNFVIHANAPVARQRSEGTITVDQKSKQVEFKVNIISTTTNGQERAELSPVNGAYPIRRITKDSLMTPE